MFEVQNLLAGGGGAIEELEGLTFAHQKVCQTSGMAHICTQRDTLPSSSANWQERDATVCGPDVKMFLLLLFISLLLESKMTFLIRRVRLPIRPC